MKSILFIVLSVSVLLILTTMIYGQEEQEQEKGAWEIIFQPFWADIKGNDLHAGDVYSREYSWQSDNSPDWEYQSYTKENFVPVLYNMEGKGALKFGVNYRKGSWGFGGSFWWLNSKSTAEGQVNTTRINDMNHEYLDTVFFWNNLFWPYEDTRNPSGKASVNYTAENTIDMWCADIHATRKLIKRHGINIELLFGGRLASLKNTRNELVSLPGYSFYEYPDTNYKFLTERLAQFKADTSADHGTTFGPLLGISGRMKTKKANFELVFKHVLLRSNLVQDRNFTYSYDYITEHTQNGDTQTSHEYYEDMVASAEKSVHFIPVAEIGMSLTFPLNSHISIGGNFFNSIWWNVPLASTWNLINSWNVALTVIPQETTLHFYGIGAEIRLSL